jgi:hypothetical protein
MEEMVLLTSPTKAGYLTCQAAITGEQEFTMRSIMPGVT